MILKLLKALSILGVVLIQWGIVILNLNRYGIFQSFIDIEFYEEHPTQEDALSLTTSRDVNLFI